MATQKLTKGFDEIRAQIEADQTPFSKTSKKEKAARKERALNDFNFFCETYFPHYHFKPSSSMHTELAATYETAVKNAEEKRVGSKIGRAAPRGNAKSTKTTLELPIWVVVRNKYLKQKLKHKIKYIGIFSDSTEQGNEFVDFIRAELEINERLREDFPDVCDAGRIWRNGYIITKNGVKIRAWGKGKKLLGARHGANRLDLVIGDDLENEESVESPEQRKKDEKWFFKAVMKAGHRGTVFVVVGTIQHYDSLLAKLLKKPGWKGKKYKSVIKWSISALWEEWEKIIVNWSNEDAEKDADSFFKKNKTAMLAGTKVLWPEEEDYYFLMKMRISDGPAFFDSEKQNEPINPEDCLFQEDWLKFWEEEDHEHEGQPNAMAVDPSMGKNSKKADPSAIICGVQDKKGFIDITEADIKKRHPDAIMEDMFMYHGIYKFSKSVIEEVQFQELFKDNVIKESRIRKLYLPVVGVRPVKDKVLRISKLQPFIKNGIIRFRRNQTTLLEQLKYFPKADHDDGPDGLEMLFNLLAKNAQGAACASKDPEPGEMHAERKKGLFGALRRLGGLTRRRGMAA